MGEMADFNLEQIEEYYEAVERGEYEPEGLDDNPFFFGCRPRLKTCRCCGTGGLHWGVVDREGMPDAKWWLFTAEGAVHICPSRLERARAVFP